MCQTAVNALVGNADAHAMNVSFVIDDDGDVNVSPLYDVFSTIAYRQLSVTPGMYIDGARDIRAIGRSHLIAEAVTWGVGAERAEEVVGEVCDRAPHAMRQAIEEVGSVPTYLAELLIARVAQVGAV